MSIINTPKLYDIILSPIITEKATTLAEQGKVIFKVKASAAKETIAQAVEQIFKVKVEKVNITVVHGKTKRNRQGIRGTRSDYKKAIVTLEKGKKIDLAAGV